jgi:hypothetical protein
VEETSNRPVEETSDRLIEAIQGVADACRHARQVFEGVEGLLDSAAGRLRGGGAIVDLVKETRISTERELVQEALEQLNTARHRFRLRVVGACIESGMTPREVAEWWGISRQRVDQFIQEYRRIGSD